VAAPDKRTPNEQFPEIHLTTCDEVMSAAWQDRA
jgi:hypothetical protein